MSAILVTEDQAFANWPTLEESIGCANCDGIFRQPENMKCPHCGSESVFDLHPKPTGHVARQLLAMVARLDEVLT